jgi:hypothetical protein
MCWYYGMLPVHKLPVINLFSMKAKPVRALFNTSLKKYSLLLLLAGFFLGGQLLAQEKMLHGYLKDSITRNPIAAGSISNRNTRVIVETDKNGFFSITVRPGDLLFFTAQGYKQDTLRYFYNIADTIHIELQPDLQDSLNVTVTTHNYSKYQQDSARRRAAFMEDAGPKTKSFSKGNSGAGIGLNLDALFKKKDRQVRVNLKRFEEREKELYVDSRFSPEMVGYYTRLKNDSLVIFMRDYRPDYEWLRNNPSQDEMLFYLNDKIKEFHARKPDQ